MSWKSHHRRGDVLRDVVEVADRRRDGRLPMDVAGVRETFGDELTLVGALQLRWHTRLSGRIERELMAQPLDLQEAVTTAWQRTAEEMPGVRAIIDHHRAEPLDRAMADAMEVSAAKEHALLAVMAGRASAQDARAARIGAEIATAARARVDLRGQATPDPAPASLLDRVKSALAVA